jgi:adenylate kinase family enzyme
MVSNNKRSYELWKGRPTSVKNFRIFGSKCYIKRYDEYLGKFDSRTDGIIFLGYSSRCKAYICYNKILKNIVESINVRINEARPQEKTKNKINGLQRRRRRGNIMPKYTNPLKVCAEESSKKLNSW